MESKPGEVTLNQPAYVRKMVRNWGMEMARAVRTPLPSTGTLSRTDAQPSREELMGNRTFVGSLLYLAQSTRPDLSNAVCQLAHVMTAPPAEWSSVVKHVVKYLSGTENLGIRYGGPANQRTPELHGYVDANWGDNKDTRRSTSGYVFFLNGGPVSWCSKMQKTIALSTVEAEYTALVHALQEAIFLRKLLVALGEDMSQPIVLYEDNNGAACLVDHPTSHARTKHIDIKRRWLDSYLQGPEPQFIVRRIPTADNVADIMTKSLAGGPHEKHTSGLLAWIGSALRSITNCCNSR